MRFQSLAEFSLYLFLSYYRQYQLEDPDFAPFSSKFDLWQAGKVALSAAELRGWSLFNDPAKGNRITKLQQDSVGFAKSLSAAVESAYQWSSDRGLAIVKTAIVSIEYDANTKELLKTVQRADALSGARGNSNLQASVAQGIQSAGENGGAAGIMGLGMATGMMGGIGGLLEQLGGAHLIEDVMENDVKVLTY